MHSNMIAQLEIKADSTAVSNLTARLRDMPEHGKLFFADEPNSLSSLFTSSSGRLGFDPTLSQLIIGILGSGGLVAIIGVIKATLDKSFKITVQHGNESLSFEGKDVKDLEKALMIIELKLKPADPEAEE